MTLQEALEEYVAMVIAGANALQRMTEKRGGERQAEVRATLTELVDRAERLKRATVDTPRH